MSPLIVSVSGLRGVVGESLTPDVAMRYVGAFSEFLAPGPVVLGRDSRPTGCWLADAVRAELAARGWTVIDAGIVPTPTLGVLVQTSGAAGGVQLTASHNPPPYNGVKLFTPEGSVIDAEFGEEVRSRFHSTEERDTPPYATYDQIGAVQSLDDPLSDHLERILARVDVDTIRGRRFRVLLDSNHGAGGPLGRRLLETLGCQVTVLGEEPNGAFGHTPEPTAKNLSQVGRDVVASQSAVGFCQDPDADRLALIDEQGRYIGEEYTLALCLDHVLPKSPGPVVTNCSTSRMAQDLAAKYGTQCHLSAVGEANVVRRMKQVGATFGGEENGGPIDPRVGYVRDSFVGMAIVLDALAAEDLSLSERVERLPRYEIVKSKFTFPRERLAESFDMLEAAYPEATASRLDGLRLDWPDRRWALLRASNTEPRVRVIVEATSREAAETLRRDIEKLVGTADAV